MYIVLYKSRKYARQHIFHTDEEARYHLIHTIKNITVEDCDYYYQDCEYHGFKVSPDGKLIIPEQMSVDVLFRQVIEIGEDDYDGDHIRSVVKIIDGKVEFL